MTLSPSAMWVLTQQLRQAADALGELRTEPLLNIIGSELPGSDAARASTDVTIALTGAIRGIAGRMTTMADIAQSGLQLFISTEDEFSAAIAKMGELQ